ncbi:MAG: ribbon-helix-helix protein, CopG family [Alteraurantiacibacter sp. bin_em_oilr2.035]|nr:ribbon-helix-helix protein, CopG family [Alteraurantiacibacter sp. bin_em_oilr2.035]
MTKQNCGPIGVQFPLPVLEEIERLAAAKDVSRSEIIRSCVNLALPLFKANVSPDISRILAIVEHTQLALSLLVERNFPEDAEPVLDMAVRNVADFHG